jgi:DNA-binding IclR family transcriptional regulator
VLVDQLQEIQRQGFAFDNEEVNIGINAVGAPIFNHEGKPVAAVVVAGLSQGITWEATSPIVSQLKHTAAKISSELYYKGE